MDVLRGRELTPELGEIVKQGEFGMARKTGVQYPGAIYHVMARGDGRAVIYRNAEDHELFLKTLEEALERFEGVLHA